MLVYFALMKKIVTLIASLLSLQLSYGQSLGYLDLPVAGEVWIEFRDTVGANFTITNAGPGQTWNYQNSFTVHDTVLFLPQNVSSAPSAIANLFPAATLASVGENPGDYTFYRIDTTGMYIDGIHSAAGVPIGIDSLNDVNYGSDELYLPVPFQYGDVIQNLSVFEYVYPDLILFPGANIRVTYAMNQDFETDGQGSLTTPLGNYPNVIRIKETKYRTELFEIDSFANGNYTYLSDNILAPTISYKWTKTGPNCLVMKADLDEFNNVVSASYYNSSGLVSDEAKNKAFEFSVQPNPVNKGNQLFMRSAEPILSCIIYDIRGTIREERILSKSQQTITLGTDQLASGLYFVKLIDNKGQERITKFVVSE